MNLIWITFTVANLIEILKMKGIGNIYSYFFTERLMTTYENAHTKHPIDLLIATGDAGIRP